MTDSTTSSFYLPAQNSSLDEANSLKKKSFSRKMAKGIKKMGTQVKDLMTPRGSSAAVRESSGDMAVEGSAGSSKMAKLLGRVSSGSRKDKDATGEPSPAPGSKTSAGSQWSSTSFDRAAAFRKQRQAAAAGARDDPVEETIRAGGPVSLPAPTKTVANGAAPASAAATSKPVSAVSVSAPAADAPVAAPLAKPVATAAVVSDVRPVVSAPVAAVEAVAPVADKVAAAPSAATVQAPAVVKPTPVTATPELVTPVTQTVPVKPAAAITTVPAPAKVMTAKPGTKPMAPSGGNKAGAVLGSAIRSAAWLAAAAALGMLAARTAAKAGVTPRRRARPAAAI